MLRTIGEILDAVKAKHAITSDYKLAMFLGVGAGNLRNYRHGRSLPDELMCERLAVALGEEPEFLLAEIQCQRAANDDAARLWRRVADRLRGGANALIVGAVSALAFAGGFSADAEAATLVRVADGVGLCIMSNALLRLTWRLARLTWLKRRQHPVTHA
jgi:transcriptional regulator with XRE-family HTH domain